MDTLVFEHYGYILRLATSLLNDADEAEDAAQETFIAAHRTLEQFRGESSPRTWLTRIAINTCQGRLRRRRTRQALQDALQALHLARPHPAGPEETAAQSETERALWQAVDSLDEKHRLPVILYYVDELSVPEIAEALQVQQGTIHSRLHYAREKLHAVLLSQTVRPAPFEHDPDRKEASYAAKRPVDPR
jgi:RNA polymerase sigma-70 factor, ECF subfamily